MSEEEGDSKVAELAEQPGFDVDAIRDRYNEEREKRLRTDGAKQYRRIDGDLADYLHDPTATSAPSRPVRTDRVDVVVIGAGFGGILAAVKLI